MGLSASQGRMLSLTSRLSDLEYRAQNISNSKIRLASESEAASKNYLDALNAKKLTAYNPDTNTHIDASLSSLYKLNNCAANGTKRIIVDAQGNVVCPSSISAANPDYILDYFNQSGCTYSAGKNISQADITNAQANATKAKNDNASAFGSEEAYLNLMFDGNVPTDPNDAKLQYFKNIYSGLEAYAQTLGYTTATNEIMQSNYWQGDVYSADGTSSYFSNNSDAINIISNAYNNNTTLSPSDLKNFSKGVTKFENDTAWLYQQLSVGNLFVVEYNEEGGADGMGSWERISYSSGDAQLVTESNDYELAKAEAEYEQAMNEIQAKDKRFDLELKTIDTEHSAIQTEMDSISKVMDKNVERSFKIFS